MSQFKARLQKIFKEVYQTPKENRKNLNDISTYTTNQPQSNQITNESILSNCSFITQTNTGNQEKRLKQSSSMKKLIQMSKQFKIDAQKTAEKYQNDKSFCIHTTMDNNGSFYISNRNTNNIFRDSSLGTMRIKRTNSLQDMIMVTESKSKYLSRSGSKKVLKNINHLKKEIEGYSSPKKEIKLFTDSTNNSFFKKKNFFGMTSHLLNQQNKNEFQFSNYNSNKGNVKSNLSIYQNSFVNKNYQQPRSNLSFFSNKNISKKIKKTLMDIDFDKAYRNLKYNFN